MEKWKKWLIIVAIVLFASLSVNYCVLDTPMFSFTEVGDQQGPDK